MATHSSASSYESASRYAPARLRHDKGFEWEAFPRSAFARDTVYLINWFRFGTVT